MTPGDDDVFLEIRDATREVTVAMRTTREAKGAYHLAQRAETDALTAYYTSVVKHETPLRALAAEGSAAAAFLLGDLDKVRAATTTILTAMGCPT